MNISNFVIAADKANHVVFGALAGLLAAWAAVLFGVDHLARLAAVIAALLLGLLKEGADFRSNRAALLAGQAPKHGVEWRDVLATVMGGVLIALAP